MVNFEIQIRDFDDLTEEEQKRQPDNGCGKECAEYLRIILKGRTIAVYSTAMEPEDCTFSRDLRWVVDALGGMYHLGRLAGCEAL